MDELVTFTKNLRPGMTSMTNQVDTRTDDLTNPSHADILRVESDQVRMCTYTYMYLYVHVHVPLKMNTLVSLKLTAL